MLRRNTYGGFATNAGVKALKPWVLVVPHRKKTVAVVFAPVGAIVIL